MPHAAIFISPPSFMSDKLRILDQILHSVVSHGHFALAFSGGLDSRFLAHAAQKLSYKVSLYHIIGPHIASEETIYARNWAQKRGLSFYEVFINPLDAPLVATGDLRRCYECKHALFSRLLEIAGRPLCDGSNASDGLSYRPGAQAVKILEIISPLALAGLTKTDIRHLAKLTGMEDPDQLPSPCLLTRLPYGMHPSQKMLSALERGESAVRSVLRDIEMGNIDFRLRLTTSSTLELHFTKDDFGKLPSEIRLQLPLYIAKAAPELPVAIVVSLQRLSGFYDHAFQQTE